MNLFFFHRVIFSPWRIVSYNVFGGPSRGPDIFGTEPWHFYIRNLLLNFNAWFVLAISAAPLIFLQNAFSANSTTRLAQLRSLVLTGPFYLWLVIFSSQPHKEERFMYPAYPFLCFNAAIALHSILVSLGNTSPRSMAGRIPVQLRLVLVIGFVAATLVTGLARTTGTVQAYHAPLEIYQSLQNQEFASSNGTICLGKEWYRFPSSYFLPNNMRARFVKSEFDGLLPGQFSESPTGWIFSPPLTWVAAPGMNNQNIEDPDKHV